MWCFVLPLSHNIKDFEFFLQRLTTRRIQNFLKLLFILFVTYFIIYRTLSTTFRFLYLQKNFLLYYVTVIYCTRKYQVPL